MTTLDVDDFGLIWLLDGESSRPLGPACDARYHDVEPDLWDVLARLIAEAEDGQRYAADCLAEVEAAYLRAKGARRR